MLDPLELELLTAVSYSSWVLEAERTHCKSSERSKHRSTSSVPSLNFLSGVRIKAANIGCVYFLNNPETWD